MHDPLSERVLREVPAVKPEVIRLALDTPLEAAFGAEPGGDASFPPVEIQLKFVQIGLWEARRRWLAGELEDFGIILARLDQDIALLGEALDSKDDPEQDRRRPRRCETAALS